MVTHLPRSLRGLDVRFVATVGLALTAATLIAWLFVTAWLAAGRVGWDATTYLAAGERLNAGHALYALGPGDRWIWINPPYWSVPLFYPPTIAVVWQPLAALPNEIGVAFWMFANGVALTVALSVIIARAGWRAAFCTALLALTIAFELKVGNVHGFIMAALVLAYLRPRLGAIAIGALTAIKLTPAVILVWLFANGHRREAIAGGIVATAALIASVLYVGIDQVTVYVAAVFRAAPSPISVPGLLGAVGVPAARVVALSLTAFMVLDVIALHGKPLSWVAAVFAMVVGSPVVNVPTLLLLLAVWLAYPTSPEYRLRLPFMQSWNPLHGRYGPGG